MYTAEKKPEKQNSQSLLTKTVLHVYYNV